jgi:hypothetical protein
MSEPEDKAFTPIPNPYIVGNPVDDQRMFFGRVDDFDFIRKKVTAGTKGGLLVLCGTRRSGKTSILFQIRNGRLGDDFVPVLLDMQSMTVRTDTEFLKNLMDEIAGVLGQRERLVGIDFDERLAQNPFATFQDFIAKVQGALDRRKLVLMFDEYELFEAHIDKERFSTDVLNLLAGWMEHREGVFILFTGSDKLEERNPRYWDHFLGKALHRRVSFLSRSDTLRLIHEPVQEYVSYAEGVPEEIYHLTSGQPFYSQVICQSLVDHLNESGNTNAAPEDVHEVVGEIIENPLPQMIFAWSSLTQLEKITLSIIAELSRDIAEPVTVDEMLVFTKEEQIGYELDPNKLRETTERLFTHDFLDKETDGEGYTFKMDLWRQWMIRMHSIWQVIDEITSEGEELEEGIVPAGRRRKRVLTFTLGTAAVLAIAVPLIYNAFFKETPATGLYPVTVDSTTVSIATRPAGATVFLDNMLIGESPVTDARVAARHAALLVTHSGFHDHIDTLDLVKDEPMEVTVVLDEIVGDLTVTSTPSNADILLNGESIGAKTPATLEALSTNELHTVRLRLPGFNDATYRGIEVLEDSTVLVHHNFSRITHPLTVMSDPPGAEIYLDGNFFGNTPRSLGSVTEGIHELELLSDGYHPHRQRIDIPVPGDELTVTLTKLPPGVLVLQISPYAELWINGELIERDAVNYRTELDPGIYQIELRHPHYGNITDPIEIKTEETTHYGNITDTIEIKTEETTTKQYRLDKKESP